MRILAVDDDTVILDLLRASFENGNFGEVSFAASAEEALNAIAAADVPFDSFLLDIMLPGISGIELCQQIRLLEAYRSAPIIMITSSKQHDIMARAFDAGATDFVSKPFDGLELGTRLNMAAMLSESLHREKAARHEMAELTALTGITFEERFDLIGIPNSPSFLALENELLRKQNALYAMTLFTVQIEGAQVRFQSGGQAQYRNMIGHVGQVMSDVLDAGTVRFAHAGQGVIVAVDYRRGRVNVAEIERELQLALDQRWARGPKGLEVTPKLVVSKVDEKRLWSGCSAAEAIRSLHEKTDVPALSGKKNTGAPRLFTRAPENAEEGVVQAPDEAEDIISRLSEQLDLD